MPEIEIRRLTTIDEFTEAVALQQEIWGFSDRELLPVRLFVVAHKVGGHSFGAFDGARMIAFLLAIPGLKDGAPGYLHSHMLGVLPEYRNLGLGRTLKLEQRQDALARGIDLVEWTFDPLELKNAFLNIEKLGATVRRYLLNNYGTTTSRLHGGMPTDRCVAEWYVGSEWVRATIAGEAKVRPAVVARVAVPHEIATLRTSDPQRAREIQARVSGQFVELTGQGLAVSAFERSEQEGIYLFSSWPFN